MSRLFVLMDSEGDSYHWEYDWKSGTSQRRRAVQHKFRVYVLLPDVQDRSFLQVVGMTASTPFTLSSYRKQDEEDVDTDSTAPPARLGRSALTTTSQTSEQPVSSVDLRSVRTQSAPVTPSDVASQSPAVPPVASLSDARVLQSPPPVDPVLARQHQVTAQQTTKLAILFHFFFSLDVTWFPARLLSSHLASVLQSSPPTQDAYVPTDREVAHYVAYVAPTLLSVLGTPSALTSERRSATAAPPSSSAWYHKWAPLLNLCADLVCQMLLQPFVSHQQASLRASSGVLRVEAQLDTFRAWVASLASSVERLVQQLSDRVSLDFLVDEIVSCMYDEDADARGSIPRAERDVTRRVLRNTSLLGWEAYSEQLRQCASALRVAPVAGVSSQRTPLSEAFNGVWVCVSVQEDQVDERAAAIGGTSWLSSGDSATHLHSGGVSLLTSMHILASCQAFELSVDPDGLNAELRSMWSVFPDLSSVFVLDARHHASAVFPNGVTPSVWQGLGFGGPAIVAGDYRAALRRPTREDAMPRDRISSAHLSGGDGDANSFALELDLFVYALHGTSYCLQLTMIASLPAQDRSSSSSQSTRALHVYARLYRGQLVARSHEDDGADRAAPLEPLPSHEELLLLSPEERRALAQFPEAAASLQLTYEWRQAPPRRLVR
ncbi:hypothetical protein PINS_up000708 [Pythium insidiosum]|nr:hypothetical protein PINS_up000708 [Pythium insidiosum]